MARFPSIDTQGNFEAPQVQDGIQRVVQPFIEAEGLEVKTAAIQAATYDANIKYGTLPNRVAHVETQATNYGTQLEGQETRLSAVETLGGLEPGDVSDATVASVVSQSESLTNNFLMGQFQAKALAQNVPQDFGAVGDGVTDDTAALQQWVQSPRPHLPVGTFLLSETIEVTKEHLTITGELGATIKLGGSHRFVTVNGNYAKISGITVDGDHVGQSGIYINGNHPIVANTILKNFRAEQDVRALQISGEGGSRIYGNTISSVVATPNDSGVVSRGVVLTYPDGAYFLSELFDNHIEHVEGGEGVAIAVNCPSNGSIHPQSLTKIYGNTCNGVSRRYLKIQGSKTTVQNNAFHDTYDIELSQPLHIISAINSDDVNITGNIFKINSPSNGISIVATDNNRFNRGTISNNLIDAPGYGAQASTRQGENVTIIGNTITIDSGTAIAETDIVNSIVTGNTVHGFSPVGDSWDISMIINLQSNCVNAIATNNTALVQPRPTRIVSNNGEGGRSENNILF